MLLSHDEIIGLLATDVVEYSEEEFVNSASLDIRLGRKILIERTKRSDFTKEEYPIIRRISLKDRTPLETVEWDLVTEGPYHLAPGEFILASSHEVFNLPLTISAQYQLKSSMARVGLEHLKAGWCDAGWNGSVLTLELKNITRFHEITLQHLDRIGQMIFFAHKPVRLDRSYAARGTYNNSRQVSGALPNSVRSLVLNEDEGV